MKLRSALACAASYVAISVAAGHAYGQTTQTTQTAQNAPAAPNAQVAQNNQNSQNGQSDQIETVVVTGVRASVKSALEIKKNADQFVDSIVAEDIGKLPDNNVIEALQHVTGIQVSRNAAEADQLLIRGLPDIATLLNGREIFTSTGRFVTLQDIPAELLARVDVEKTPRADDIEGGIAGLIDVRLHRPFDFDGLQIAGGFQETHSSLSTKNDPSGSLLVSDRWQTTSGEWGLLVDLSYRHDRYKEEILDNYIDTQAVGSIFVPLTEGAQSINGDRLRESANVALQWNPNSNVETYAEFFYTRYRNPNNVDFFVGLPWIGATPATVTAYPGTDLAKTADGGGYDLTSDQSFVPKTDTYQAATGATWTSDNVTLSTELDYTDSRFQQVGYILDTEYYPTNYVADFNYNNTGTPYMLASGVSLTDPSNFHIRQLYDQWTHQYGNEIDWRGDMVYDMGGGSFIKTIVAGVRYVDRFAQNRADNPGGLDCRADPASDISTPQYPAIVAAVGSAACFTPLSALPGTAYHVTSGSIFNGQFGVTNWLDADPKWLVQNINYLRTLFGQPAGPPPEDPTQAFDDRQTSYAGYVKADFGFDVASLPVDGNIGVRLIDTQSTMKGNVMVVTGNPPPPAIATSYSFTYNATNSSSSELDWLPSLNARMELDDGLFLRLAASRTVTYPQFAQLDPGLSLSASTGTLLGSGTAGNPNLGPEKSNNADLSLEYYFGGQNAVTGAVFYRDVDGYIEGNLYPLTIGGVTYQISSYQNAPAGHIDGAEVGYTEFFDFLPDPFKGLGLQTNGTVVEGAFQNISKWSYNVIGIYEYGPASLRVAYNWRSGFNAGPAPGGGMQPATVFARAQPWLDLYASYQVSDQVTLTFDATNLLNSYYQSYFGSPQFPQDTRRFDQTIVFGIRYKM
jgi:TonB-dependent receptor